MSSTSLVINQLCTMIQATLDFFVSTSETATEMSMLRKLDAELLLGHLSYKQKADIYNYHITMTHVLNIALLWTRVPHPNSKYTNIVVVHVINFCGNYYMP